MSLWPCMLPMLWYWGWNICSFVCLLVARLAFVCVCPVLSCPAFPNFPPFFPAPSPPSPCGIFQPNITASAKCCCPLGCYYFKFLFSVVFFFEFFFFLSSVFCPCLLHVDGPFPFGPSPFWFTFLSYSFLFFVEIFFFC